MRQAALRLRLLLLPWVLLYQAPSFVFDVRFGLNVIIPSILKME
jgi:hypothetical protein